MQSAAERCGVASGATAGRSTAAAATTSHWQLGRRRRRAEDGHDESKTGDFQLATSLMRSDALVRVELLLCNLRKTALRSARLHFSNHWAVLALAVFWLWGAREPLFIGPTPDDGRIADRLFRRGSMAHRRRAGRRDHWPNSASVLWSEADLSIGTFRFPGSRVGQMRAST